VFVKFLCGLVMKRLPHAFFNLPAAWFYEAMTIPRLAVRSHYMSRIPPDFSVNPSLPF